MGVLANVKELALRPIKKVANKAANGISELSKLSEKQIEEIEKKKKEYYAQKPNMDNDDVHRLISRELGEVGVEVYHAYLTELSTIYSPVVSVSEDADYRNRIAYFDITKWVLDVEENYIDKLVNVYHVMSKTDCSIALIFNRSIEKCTVTMAVVNNGESDPTVIGSYKSRLIDAIKGNFPGSELKTEEAKTSFGCGIPPCLNKKYKDQCVASITNVATEKSEKFISQSIEKLLDGVVPENAEQEYTFVLLATPVQNVMEEQTRLSEFYTALAPYATYQTNYTYVTSDNESSSFSGGIYLGASAGMQAGGSIANTLSDAVTKSKAHTSANTFGVNAGVNSNKNLGVSAGVNAGVSAGTSVGVNYSHSSANTTGEANTQGVAVTSGSSTGASAGANFGVNFSRASNVNVSVGKNEGITQTFTNHQVKHTLDILEMQMKRLEKCAALGAWNFASYVVSNDYNTVNHVAHMYLALTQGEESYISQSAINLWHSSKSPNETKILYNEIKHLQHPAFYLRSNLSDDWLMYPTGVDATTTVSGRELAYSFNLPRKSVAGFPVIECAEFSRNVVTYDNMNKGEKVRLGNIFHMNHEENCVVDLNLQSLASHVFITGSTGAGKSNTIYQMLYNLMRNKVKFLVVEPAKGEYKHIFGNENGVKVYGTNPKLMPLLRLNPFSFPSDIHVLEHLDRLVEIFNVCWPMYAAMPAVLKSAVEKSYEDCGWDLVKSRNNYGENMYPTFADVARNVKSIIDSSEYDSENKGAYKGSLLTRLHSLTNGINGMVFTSDELSNAELFDSNVIVDLSRVGSNETKSLIMGMIVLKLQEYRMTSYDINSSLKHVTVLEEAHNLLKRTSTEQPVEGGNLLGKSVEMISNAIAEMRTYGEGFIIADQAPALLDMAAIRNTNTKIIMRLPDQSDRELVGRAANLNDDQIAELAKLPCGVAAIYQNEWIQPVLCKIDKRVSTETTKRYAYDPNKVKTLSKARLNEKLAIEIAELICNGTKIAPNEVYIKYMPELKASGINAYIQASIAKLLLNPIRNVKFTKIAPIMGALFPKVRDAVRDSYNESFDEKEWTASAESALNACINTKRISDNVRRDIVQAIITDYIYNDLGNKNDMQRWAEKGGLK